MCGSFHSHGLIGSEPGLDQLDVPARAGGEDVRTSCLPYLGVEYLDLHVTAVAGLGHRSGERGEVDVPIIPRLSRVSAAKGVTQSPIWKLTIRSPARPIWSSTPGSHHKWYVSTTTPTTSAGNCSTTSRAWASVETTPRSAANTGCIGSTPNRTPAVCATGTSSAMA
jgi:hypothetical protein